MQPFPLNAGCTLFPLLILFPSYKNPPGGLPMRKIRAAVPIALCAVAGLVGLPALTAAQSPTPNPRPLPPDNYGTPTPTPTPTYHIGQKDTSSLPTASPTPVPEQTAQAVPESVLKLPQLYRPPSHSALASVARVLRGRGRPLSVRKIVVGMARRMTGVKGLHAGTKMKVYLTRSFRWPRGFQRRVINDCDANRNVTNVGYWFFHPTLINPLDCGGRLIISVRGIDKHFYDRWTRKTMLIGCHQAKRRAQSRLKRRIRHRLSLPCGRIDLSDGTTGNPLGDAKAARLVFGFKNGTHGHLQYWVLAQPKVCTKRWGRSEKCYSLQRRQGAPAV
jgi:hypothetical protein